MSPDSWQSSELTRRSYDYIGCRRSLHPTLTYERYRSANARARFRSSNVYNYFKLCTGRSGTPRLRK